MSYGKLPTSKSVQETLSDLQVVFHKWGIEEWDTPQTTSRGRIIDTVAVVYFTFRGKQRQMACQRFPTYEQNLRALYLNLDSLRLSDQRGILDDLGQFFEALPAPSGAPTTETPYEILGLSPMATLDVAETVYRSLAKKAHADTGGSDKAMARLNAAIDSIRKAKATRK